MLKKMKVRQFCFIVLAPMLHVILSWMAPYSQAETVKHRILLGEKRNLGPAPSDFSQQQDTTESLALINTELNLWDNCGDFYPK